MDYKQESNQLKIVQPSGLPRTNWQPVSCTKSDKNK